MQKHIISQETVRILLPLPPSILSPNRPIGSRKGRYMFAAASKRFRRLAKEATVEVAPSHPWEKCTVEAFFYHKVKRKRDDINHLAMLKPAYDGVVDAGLVVDDSSEHLTTLPCHFRIDKKNPRVELLFTRIR